MTKFAAALLSIFTVQNLFALGNPIPTTSSTTSTTLEQPYNGDVTVKKIRIQIGRPFDYKINSSAAG